MTTWPRGSDRARLVPMLAGLWELVPWLRQWHNEVDPTFGERLGDFFASFTTEQAGALGHTTDDSPPGGRRLPPAGGGPGHEATGR